MDYLLEAASVDKKSPEALEVYSKTFKSKKDDLVGSLERVRRGVSCSNSCLHTAPVLLALLLIIVGCQRDVCITAQAQVLNYDMEISPSGQIKRL